MLTSLLFARVDEGGEGTAGGGQDGCRPSLDFGKEMRSAGFLNFLGLLLLQIEMAKAEICPLKSPLTISRPVTPRLTGLNLHSILSKLSSLFIGNAALSFVLHDPLQELNRGAIPAADRP